MALPKLEMVCPAQYLWKSARCGRGWAAESMVCDMTCLLSYSGGIVGLIRALQGGWGDEECAAEPVHRAVGGWLVQQIVDQGYEPRFVDRRTLRRQPDVGESGLAARVLGAACQALGQFI